MNSTANTTTALHPAPRGGLDDAPVRFRADVVINERDGALYLLSPVGGFALRGLGTRVTAAIRRLTHSRATPSALAGELDNRERGQLAQVLRRAANLLVRGIGTAERLLMEIEVTAQDAGYQVVDLPRTAPVKLSKFALLRTHAGTLVLESPLARHRALLRDPVSRALVSALGTPGTAAELAEEFAEELPEPVLTDLLAHLVGAGFAELGMVRDGSPVFPSDTDPVLRQWDFHDLLSHSRSRTGRFDQPFGGVFPYRGEIEPRPAVKPLPQGPAIPLYRPALAAVLARDPALTTVLEGRTSVRQYAEHPLTAEQLGEFLFRTARVRAVYGPSEATPYAATTRPYPCGGAAYELELYLTVRRCAGVEPGIYYYDPLGHQLVLVNGEVTDREAMLHTASVATGMQANPDVLITMTSRFQRLSWKYRAIAYAVTLRHAGVLYQTMYLVATAMGLAPCGLGSGNADLAARAFGLDYLSESSVGDFILGSRPIPPEGAPPSPLPERWHAVNDPEWAVAAQSSLRALHHRE